MWTRPAFVFPGQGSQRPGMGSAVVTRPHAREIFSRLEDLSGEPLVSAMSDGPEERLRRTGLAQLAVFGLSVALTRELADSGVLPAVVAGHSLGEFSALVAAGCLDFDSAARLVAVRAKAMSRCCTSSAGAMVAVFGVPGDTLQACIDSALGVQSGHVVIAGENSPKQVVISGDAGVVAQVVQNIIESEIGSTQELEVEGAFHSPLMLPAELELQPLIDGLPLTLGHTPLISSVTGQQVTDMNAYRAALARQITSPVRWEQVARQVLSHTSGHIIEVGPGSALRSLIRKIDRSRDIVTFDDLAPENFLTGSYTP